MNTTMYALLRHIKHIIIRQGWIDFFFVRCICLFELREFESNLGRCLKVFFPIVFCQLLVCMLNWKIDFNEWKKRRERQKTAIWWIKLLENWTHYFSLCNKMNYPFALSKLSISLRVFASAWVRVFFFSSLFLPKISYCIENSIHYLIFCHAIVSNGCTLTK